MKASLLVSAICLALQTSAFAEVSSVKTLDEPGKVIASGSVPDEASRATILARLRELYGAQNVVDRLEIGGVVLAPAAVTNSRVRLVRDLTDRPWLNQPTLPSWTGTNLLANTIVQALVDQTGRVLSTTLLAGAGQREVDDYALELVRQARFETRPGAAALALGTLVFEWHAAPPASTP